VIGADTSFLVGLAVRDHPGHQTCWRVFRESIRGRPASLALAPQALAEFVHVVTDPRRFEQPLPVHEALELCEQWWDAEECHCVVASREATTLFLSWMHTHGLGRKRLLDTLLAASYYTAGVRRIATTDWRDFSIFGVFDVVAIQPG
jgi:predicted nucleic acid-binding protein